MHGEYLQRPPQGPDGGGLGGRRHRGDPARHALARRLIAAGWSAAGLAGVTVVLHALGVTNHTTVALTYLLVVLFTAAAADLRIAVAISIAAAVCFNYFFLPPVRTLRLADPANWIVLLSFLVVSIVASQLSASARAQAHDALERRNALTRLFDLTRDILLMTEREGALEGIARQVARRFELDLAAICVPGRLGGWAIHHGGTSAPAFAPDDLNAAFAASSGALEFDARTRSYGGQRQVTLPSGTMTLVPVRIGTRAIALLATGGRALEAGTRDAIAGVVAIALERSDFLRERHQAELSRQRAELSSALLASLSHDLRTPLTAIRTAVSNLESLDLGDRERRDQARVASGEIARLTRLFDEILDMARIDAKSVTAQRQWTTPGEIVEAAISQAAGAVSGREVRIDTSDEAVQLDPRLAASALAHLLENAARYAPEGPIDVRGWTDGDGARFEVRDAGPGLQPSELARLFEPFYRGESIRQRVPGTGMGLAITRGLLAADGGRVWAENVAPAGAAFSVAIPAPTRSAAVTD